MKLSEQVPQILCNERLEMGSQKDFEGLTLLGVGRPNRIPHATLGPPEMQLLVTKTPVSQEMLRFSSQNLQNLNQLCAGRKTHSCSVLWKVEAGF